MKRLNKTYVSGAVCILFGIWILLQTGSISENLVSNEPGPRLFPYIAAIGIIVCSVLTMLFDGPKESQGEQKPYLDKDGWKRLGLIFLLLLIFALGMEFIGFLPTSIVMTAVFIITLKQEKKASPAAIGVMAVGLSCLVYFGFTKGFHIPLPSGRLWEALGVTLPF